MDARQSIKHVLESIGMEGLKEKQKAVIAFLSNKDVLYPCLLAMEFYLLFLTIWKVRSFVADDTC